MTARPLLTHEYFEPLAGRPFAVNTPDGTIEIRVTEVSMLPPPKRRTLSGKTVDVEAARLPFSVYFRSEGELALQQGTYSMVPPDGSGETMDIFIVPLGFEDGGAIYEAVFV